MATMTLLSPNPSSVSWLSFPSENRSVSFKRHRPLFRPSQGKKSAISAGFVTELAVLSSSSGQLQEFLRQNENSVILMAETGGYSLASYYTSLGLFVISVPGLWSLIKRSVKSKIVQKTFIGEGETRKEPKQVAGEILSFFTRNNFAVADRGETIT